ncbi:MAG: GAF domain-containing protein [Chloroflexi bacterium]|nr:GAF domain-containing protein [Chloroflexota bacterium]
MSRWLPFPRDLGLQLLALYLLFVGPVIIAAFIFDALAGARLEHDVQSADLALARSIALETDASLQNALNTVAQLSLSPQVQSRDTQHLAPLFAAVATARQEINLVYFLDADGIMRYHYPEGPGTTVGTDFSHRQYFQEALVSRAPLMSAGRISPTTNQPVVTAVMPVRLDNSFIGVVATNISLEQLSSTLAHISSDPDTELSVSILDSTGQIVADSDPARILTDARADFPAETDSALRGETASRISRDTAEREWLRSYVPIPAAGWAVVVQRPTDLAFASPRAFRNGLLIAISIFLIGGLFFWIMLSRRVIAPLERLAAFSAAISQRAVAPTDRTHLARHSERADQVGHLIRALTQMERDIERRFTELSTLLDTSTAVVSTLDSQRVLEIILEQVQRLLGIEKCAIIALDERANELRLRAARGLSEDYLRRIRTRDVNTRPIFPSARAIRAGHIVQVSDIETESDFPPPMRERARAEGYRALLAAPLLTPHAPPAALIVYWPQPHTCPPEEINLIVNFANQAAMAIENASLFALTDEKLREQTRTLEALVQSLNDGLILESSDGRILYCNRRICELADVSLDDIPTHTAHSLRQKLIGRGALASPNELSIQHTGRVLDLRLQSFDVTDEQGQLIGGGQLWLDITGDKELDRMKSALIATASHELRTPLAAIKGNVTSLLADDVQWDAASQREFLIAASAETDRLTALVNDLLDLSKIQAGTFVVHREPCALAPLVTQAAHRVRPPLDSRLHLDLPPTLPLFPADPPRIEAVLRNLIENAAKYSPPDSSIRIDARQTNGHILIRVADDGPGIPPDHRERIFDRFYRVDSGLARQASGAGLGLAICKGFVEAHGGRIWVQPAELGAVFAFTLPL